jgi:hypothetical protein
MKTEDLKIGVTYQIAFTEITDPGYSPDCYYEGLGILREFSPADYPRGTLKFDLIETNPMETGYFDSKNVVAEITIRGGKQMPKNIEVIDSNENGTLSIAMDNGTSTYGIISRHVFIPCKDKATANKVFALLRED